MKSIYFKNFTVTASMVLLSFLILGIAFVLLGKSFVINDKREDMSVNADAVAQIAGALAADGALGSWELRMSVSVLARSSGNHIFLCDKNGVVVVCSDNAMPCQHTGRQMGGPVMSAIGSSGIIDGITLLDGFYPVPHYVIAKPVIAKTPDGSGMLLGYVFVGSDSSSIVEAWRTFMTVFFAVGLVVLLMALLFSYYMSKRQAKPVKEMAAAAIRFAHGNFSVRVEEDDRDDEIGALTQAFNTMADSLEAAEEQRREFIANVSHELKTPMTAIAGFADGILDGTIPPELQSKYLMTISSETKRLARLVRRMLDLSPLQSKSLAQLRGEDFDINEILQQTLLNFEGKITDKDLDVDAQLPEASMRVLGDADSINQVAYNLLDNAVKFAVQGGRLGLSLWKQDGKAFVSVSNTGQTIPAEELARVFDRFHKTDRSRSIDRDGVGLGLYIVKTILNQHGENIWVTSADGVTTFTFTLTIKT